MRRRKYTYEFILSIINEHNETGAGSKVLGAKYGINDARVAEWLKEYHVRGSESFLRDGKNKSYDSSIKRQAVEEYLEGKGSIQELTIKYGIRCRKQLREWIKVYNSGRGFRHRMSGGSRMKETRPTTVEERIQIAKYCMVNDREVKRYKNIEIPAEIKHLEYCGFRFDVPEDGGAITFKIWFNEGILPEIWPAERERQHRATKTEPVAMMEQRYGVTGADRKTLVAVISTITGIGARYLGMPSQAYQIGEYLVDKEGTLTGPENEGLISALAIKGYEAK